MTGVSAGQAATTQAATARAAAARAAASQPVTRQPVTSQAAATQRENQSVRKAAAILRAAADSASGATVSALARAAELPRATALRMIESLVAESLLARLPDDRIVIGPGVHSLARAANLTELLVDAARDPLDLLATRTEESITLTVVLPDGSLSLVRQLDGPHMLGLTNWVGRPVALHASSSGKLALAFADESRLAAVIRAGLPAVASRTITHPEAFRTALQQIRADGWSEIEDEIEDGLAAVSVGIFFDGAMVGSVNISGPTARLTRTVRAAAVPELRRACAQIEQNLGARPAVSRRARGGGE